jgi:GntR family transcriptional regulator, transcriptional repressor for pyruvate dehydrogenase complex
MRRQANDIGLTPLNRGKLGQQVVSKIKSLIFSEGIQTGEKLPSERELAEQLQVSRSVVREALNTLEQSGLIEIRRGRGAGAYIVDHLHKPLLSSAVDLMKSGKIDVRQFLEVRKAIECSGIRTAANRITEEDRRQLEVINDRFLETVNDGLAASDANTAFHLALLEFCGNPLMTVILRSLLDLMAEMRFFNPGGAMLLKSVHRAHQKIIDAIREKDWAQCEQLLAANIEQSRDLESRIKNISYSTNGQEARRGK